jgi:hypothetical protein
MPAAARYIGMFRAAAVFYLFFGASFLWTFGFTDRYAAQRLVGLALGSLLIAVGVFLLRRTRWAIGLSALGTTVTCLSATLAVASLHGPAILFVACLAIISAIYTVLSLRVLLGRGEEAAPGA